MHIYSIKKNTRFRFAYSNPICCAPRYVFFLRMFNYVIKTAEGAWKFNSTTEQTQLKYCKYYRAVKVMEQLFWKEKEDKKILSIVYWINILFEQS